MSDTKYRKNFCYKPKKSKINVFLNIYQKLNLYYLQSSNEKQQLNLFSDEFFLFQFVDFINNPSSISTLQNNHKINRSTLFFYNSEEKGNQKKSLFLEKQKITVDSFFVCFLINNYWLECYEKKFVNSFITFTGENWLKNHFLLKKKLLSKLKFNPNNFGFVNYLNKLNSFFKETLTFNQSFFPPSFNSPSKKSVISIWNLFLFEFHQKLYKVKNYSYLNKIYAFEKSLFNIQCLKLNFLFQAVPVFFNNILMHRLNSLGFLPKTKTFLLKSIKETKLQFFSFKQILNKYYCFYFNQKVAVGSPYILINYPCTKFVSNSFCQPFNCLDQRFLKFIKKMPFTSLSRFSLNFDFQVSKPLNLKSSDNPFVLNIPKQKLNSIHNYTYSRFLTNFKLLTFYTLFTLRKADNKQPFKKKDFDVCLGFQNSNIRQIMFELKTILLNLMKKLAVYFFYLKTLKGFRKIWHKKKCKLLNPSILLKKDDSFFFNLRKFCLPFLCNQSKYLFKDLFFSIDYKQLVISIKNQSKKLKYSPFLSVFNHWVLQNYPQIPPMIINKQENSHVFQKEKRLHNIYFKNLKKRRNDGSSLQTLSFYYNESFIGLLITTGLYYILPNELNVVQYLNLLKKYIKFSSTQTQELLMKTVHPKIYTWCYFYRFTTLNQIFYSLDTQLLKWLWRWACRRHNNKSKNWIKSKYFCKFNQKNWVFGTIVLEKSLKSSSELIKANSFALPLLSYFPFHSQIVWNLKKA